MKRENTLEFGDKHFGEEGRGAGDENDRRNKRITEMQIDRVSELPNSLIIHILSSLNVKEAAITSVLSKRWEFLWAESPNLEFRAGMTDLDSPDTGAIEKVRNFVSWVNRTLTVRTGNYLEKFEVSFVYHTIFSSDVDAWVQFATKNKVKKLNLHLHLDVHGFDDFYTPPHALYSCPSLTTLQVRGCAMHFKRSIEWQSLTSLHLQVVYMDQRLLDEILSNCPVLYTLILDKCRGFDRLEVKSRILHSLSIVDCQSKNDAPSLKISAPYIHRLHIFLSGTGRMLQVGNISSLVRADIDYQEFPLESTSLLVMSGARELLESLQNVKELSLGLQFLKVVSLMEVDGWQLPQSTRKLLKVDSSSEYHELSISGIIALLESSPNLETLVIMGYYTEEGRFILEPLTEDDLADLLHLKNIRVKNFANSKGEPMLSLARILLKRATMLETMVMTTDVKDLSDYAEIVQEVLTYPRSSTKALVHLLNDSNIV